MKTLDQIVNYIKNVKERKKLKVSQGFYNDFKDIIDGVILKNNKTGTWEQQEGGGWVLFVKNPAFNNSDRVKRWQQKNKSHLKAYKAAYWQAYKKKKKQEQGAEYECDYEGLTRNPLYILDNPDDENVVACRLDFKK
jgi:hypothetical protein